MVPEGSPTNAVKLSHVGHFHEAALLMCVAPIAADQSSDCTDLIFNVAQTINQITLGTADICYNNKIDTNSNNTQHKGAHKLCKSTFSCDLLIMWIKGTNLAMMQAVRAEPGKILVTTQDERNSI